MNVEFLADHEAQVPQLARWAFDEWSYLHPERSLAEYERTMAAACNRDELPICLVAIDNDEPVGMVTLKEKDFSGRPDLNPWLATLYVDKPHRGKRIGTQLVRRLVRIAARLGNERLYLVTDHAANYYARLGWRVLQSVEWQGQPVTVMETGIADS